MQWWDRHMVIVIDIPIPEGRKWNRHRKEFLVLVSFRFWPRRIPFPGGSDGKCVRPRLGRLIPGLGRSSGGGHGNPLHNWATNHCIYIYIYLWEKSENKGRKIPKLENVLTPFFYKVQSLWTSTHKCCKHICWYGVSLWNRQRQAWAGRSEGLMERSGRR